MVVRVSGHFSSPGVIEREVRKGDFISPLLFSLHVEETIEEAMENFEK